MGDIIKRQPLFGDINPAFYIGLISYLVLPICALIGCCMLRSWLNYEQPFGPKSIRCGKLSVIYGVVSIILGIVNIMLAFRNIFLNTVFVLIAAICIWSVIFSIIGIVKKPNSFSDSKVKLIAMWLITLIPLTTDVVLILWEINK